MTQEQFSDLKRYLPKSDIVKMVFEELHPEDVDSKHWEETIVKMAERTLDGDCEALFELLELTYLNAHNEGLLDGTDYEEQD